NRNSPVNQEHNIQQPLPEPLYVINSKTKRSDLWESQLQVSPVNIRALSGSLRQKAESELEMKWQKIENELFAEAFLSWKARRVTDKIYSGPLKSSAHFQSGEKLQKNDLSIQEFNKKLEQHLKVSDKSQNLTLGDMDEELFKMLQELWALDRRSFRTNLEAMQNDFDDINEFHRRLYTLSRQILQHKIVENWQTMKSFLAKTQELSESDVKKIETMFRLSTRFPDMTKPTDSIHKNNGLEQLFTENNDKITSMLEKIMGPTEAEARIETFIYLQQKSEVKNWWTETDYMERHIGNGLNLWDVIRIGETLSFDVSSDEFSEKGADALRTLALLEGTCVHNTFTILPWYISPERAFIMKHFRGKFEERIKILLNEERKEKNFANDRSMILLRQQPPRLQKELRLNSTDIWNFFLRGLSIQFMVELYVTGIMQGRKTRESWIKLLNRAPKLLSPEQSSFVIHWFQSAKPTISVDRNIKYSIKVKTKPPPK
ncbi:hypothetical protein O181_092411, partial [Austropuccinia psidii MF-1]|nr:hypothetical protein [Austropuccinia psidii MF-1]